MTKLRNLTIDDQGMCTLRNVRVSFPRLVEEQERNGKTYKRGATFMLPKDTHSGEAAALKAHAKGIADKNKAKVPAHKVCIRDGDEETRPEYSGHWIVSTSTKTRPTVINSKGVQVFDGKEVEDLVYGGCVTNCRFNMWFQDNEHGTRINGGLVTVQFARDGEPLDGTHVPHEQAIEGFGAVDEDDEEVDDFLKGAA